MQATSAVPPRWGLAALLLLSVFAWAPATFPGYWQGSEGFVPIFNLGQAAPIAHVAATPDLWRGMGSAAFLPADAMLFAGITPVAAVRYSFILCFLLGGLGIYLWLQMRLGDRAAALAGLVYLMLPIFLATVYVRGSLDDAFVLAWLPMAFAGLAAYGEKRSLPGAALAVLAILWMWRTQAGLAALATIMLVLYAVIVERSWITTLIAAVAGIAGLVTLIPLWSIVAAPDVTFGDHFVELSQLFATGWAAADTPGYAGEGMLHLGFVAITFGILAVWGWWTADRSAVDPLVPRLLGFGVAGTVLLALLSLGVTAALWQSTNADRLLSYPWQLLLLAAPLVAAVAGTLPRLVPDLEAPAYWLALVALVVLSGFPYLSPQFTTVEIPKQPVAVVGQNQIAILHAKISEGDDPHAARLDVTWQPLQQLPFDYNVFFQAIEGEGAGERVVAQLDASPLGPDQPATSWHPGAVLRQSYQLDLSGATTAAPLRYYFGYYDWRNGARLWVDGGIDDKLVLYGE
jgi:hypothetical protein